MFCLYTQGFEGKTAFNNTDPQLIRIDFTMPNGFIRHLVIGFMPNNAASDDYDYGYDALNMDDYPYDLNWMIEENRYVIQGVGAFDDSKKYPLGLFMSNSGNIEIKLDRLENFDTEIDVLIYDSVLDTYSQINESAYKETVNNGEYTDRFYLAFKDNNSSAFAKNSLSTNDNEIDTAKINYLSNTKELLVKTNSSDPIKDMTVYSINGQKVYDVKNIRKDYFKISLPNLNSNYGIISIETLEGKITSKQIAFN